MYLLSKETLDIFTDCLVLGCRLVLIMEDLLWVLTDDQLKAALHFADSLTGLLKRATEETQKIKGARKLEVLISNFFVNHHIISSTLNTFQSLSEIQGQSKDKSNRNKKANNSSANVAAKVFSRYDVVETSYHFYSDRIDLHLCDDPGGSKCSFMTTARHTRVYVSGLWAIHSLNIKSYSFGSHSTGCASSF